MRQFKLEGQKAFLCKWKHGIFFILSVPVFALLYAQYPTEFYQSTVAQEGMVKNVDSQFSELVRNAIRNRLSDGEETAIASDSYGCKERNVSPERYDIRAADPIAEFSSNGNRVPSTWMTVALWEACKDDMHYQILFNVNLDVRRGYNRQLLITNFFPEFSYESRSYGQSANASEFDSLTEISSPECDKYKKHILTLTFNEGICSFSLSEVEASSIDNILDGYKDAFAGNINGKGLYWRTLYLSTVTVTTLGYGDIVPTTGITRFLIALQSISGLILMGLFINSVAGRR